MAQNIKSVWDYVMINRSLSVENQVNVSIQRQLMRCLWNKLHRVKSSYCLSMSFDPLDMVLAIKHWKITYFYIIWNVLHWRNAFSKKENCECKFMNNTKLCYQKMLSKMTKTWDCQTFVITWYSVVYVVK